MLICKNRLKKASPPAVSPLPHVRSPFSQVSGAALGRADQVPAHPCITLRANSQGSMQGWLRAASHRGSQGCRRPACCCSCSCDSGSCWPRGPGGQSGRGTCSGREDPGCQCRPPLRAARGRPGLDTQHGGAVSTTVVTRARLHCLGTQYLHDVVGLQPCVGRGVDEDVGEGILVVIHLVCKGDGPASGHHSGLPTSALPSCRIFPAFLAILPEPLDLATQAGLVSHEGQWALAPALTPGTLLSPSSQHLTDMAATNRGSECTRTHLPPA